ncbi:cell adhesion molecule DSCAML1-like [Argiope bruennichi]|uniref:cell adhesion molecule DSCAML1-like n=1 Tax=Argiope bruennichi TaxID=94029 RepID=UPI002494FE0F|nr:cell adhesion molecule DSCAML1-like [Argiope bruennichi]
MLKWRKCMFWTTGSISVDIILMLALSSTAQTSESPIIEKFQFKENIKEGDFVSVLCIVKTGTQPISFFWYKNGEEFQATNKDVSIENSPISSILVMNAVTSKSNGNYTCTAKNNFGSDRHSTTLKVKAPPLWVEQPKNVTTVIGEAISINCKASGSPDPRTFWRKRSGSGALMEINATSSHSKQNSTVLHISKVSSDDAGMYECIADNGIPPTIISNFTITIRVDFTVNVWRCTSDIVSSISCSQNRSRSAILKTQVKSRNVYFDSGFWFIQKI